MGPNPKVITFNGETVTRESLCVKHGITKATFNWRLKEGWSLEKIFSVPPKSYNRKISIKERKNNIYNTVISSSKPLTLMEIGKINRLCGDNGFEFVGNTLAELLYDNKIKSYKGTKDRGRLFWRLTW